VKTPFGASGRWFPDHMTESTSRPEPSIDSRGLWIGAAVGVPAAIGIGAGLAAFRPLFDTTNAALVLMIVVVATAALGGRAAGIVAALAGVVSCDFFHTEPYLSLAIDSRDDVETTILLLLAAVLVGTIAAHGRTARRREGSATAELRRIQRVAAAAASGRTPADVIGVAQDELRGLLALRDCRFEARPTTDDQVDPRIGRRGAVEGVSSMTFGHGADGRGGFELPVGGVRLPVVARGQHVASFVLVPTPGRSSSLEQRLVAVAIADQVAAVWTATAHAGVPR